ncbi:MAG: leucine-rich repeat domain-containing protein [Bacteroidales bacterium]|nr:leucine-rich repeat domain-containing protein [Bacteroidales bacterium]
MRYKIFTLFAALTLSADALFASDTAVDGIYYDFDATNLTATVTYRGSNSGSYADEYTGNVVIPATVTYGSNTYSVTSIGESAFYDCSGLTSVTIPNSVTSIGDLAFYKCSGLTSVNIGNSVTSIGRSAFANCSVLTSVTIPNSVTSIGVSAFSECIGLTSVIIPNSVTSIGAWAFDGTAWLANQSDGVIYINQLLYTYKGEMPANTSISVLDGTTQICGGAFYDCSGLTSVTIPNSVTSIGMYAFESCSGLTSVTIPNSVTSIEEGAFYQCSGLTSVTIPNSVTSIGWGAFYGCSGLTSVTIPNSVTSIGDQAFDECTQLTNIVCYAAVPPSCDASSFANYNASLKVPYSSLEAYKADAVWGLFNNISYIESTVGLEQIELADLYTQAGRIVCEGEFRIYDLLGHDVTRLNGSLHGVYVVKTANAAVKVVVR